MQTAYNLEEARALGLGACAVALGIFDGVHLGHQALLARTCSLARAHNLAGLAVTFAPHPAVLLRPERAPLPIEPLAARLQHMAALGLSAALVLPFDAALARMPAETFVQSVLQETLDARHVVVGYDFSFGQGQRGNAALLRQLGAPAVAGPRAFATHVVEAVRQDGVIVSSSEIRRQVTAGDMVRTGQLLGRPFALYGTVEAGLQRGRTLGYPTANLRLSGPLVPPYGVYAGMASGPFAKGPEPAAVSIGVHPTFAAATATKVEAFLLDYRGPAFYDAPLTLTLEHYLRPEIAFDSVPALLAQMAKDCRQVRACLGSDTAPA